MRKFNTSFCFAWGCLGGLRILFHCCAYKKRIQKGAQLYLLFLGLCYFPVNAKPVQDSFVDYHVLNPQVIDNQLQALCYKVLPMGIVSGSCTNESSLPSYGRRAGSDLPVSYDAFITSEALIVSPAFIETLIAFPYSHAYLQKRAMSALEEEIFDRHKLSYGQYVNLNIVKMLGYDKFEQMAFSSLTTYFDLSEPLVGEFQYYSQQGHLLNNAMSFDVELPIVQRLNLSMQARWDIEKDYDYSQVLVDGVAIAGNHTKASNQINHARNILTGSSNNIIGTSEKRWVDLTYDLSGYAGRKVRITVNYVTDEAEGYDGIVIGNIAVNQKGDEIYLDGSELNELISLVGFERVADQTKESNQGYIMQPGRITDIGLALYSTEN
ncbi:immune inhibitor A domain-containing protein [uncultured Shewanella sp.]|uniref:immune inhibitor A domain-containing protein n=1 Tax=uncultured Shewanella sp. TaxID=173975 RepID=UPI00262436D0|nr:immune inhibitor A domain-containing protein [uncultured Shewanella sp.]